MATTSNMFMYSLTLVPPNSVTHLIPGRFVGNGRQQMLFAQGSRLTLVRIEKSTGKWQTILTHDCFGVIRYLQAFRLAGSSKDYIIIGSDSGRISILEYMAEQNVFVRVHSETFGKSGVRRVVPGQYLAADPKGRAVMIASLEKNKLVYVLNRNTENDLTISSPLEAHKHFTVVYDLVGVDVGYKNPIFAALEVDYEDADQNYTDEIADNAEKQLVYYQLDLGLNHVVRTWSDTVDRTAYKLFAVPGGSDGPGGVLVCGKDSISYQDMLQDVFRVPIPRRKGAAENPHRKRSITAGALYRSRGSYFLILQTVDGDLFKAEVLYESATLKDDDSYMKATRLVIKYFGTVPVASNLVILNDGWLYVATEAGDHMMYYFESRGDDDDRPIFTSDDNSPEPKGPMEPVYFDHRDDPEYLVFHASFRSLNPITGCKVTNLTEEDAPQIYTINGSGPWSTLRSLRHALTVSEIAQSPLPQYPSAVWTTKMKIGDQYDSYIVLSFSGASFVLSVTGTNVEEASNTGLITSSPTVAVQALEDAMLQVHPRGIRHIRYSGKVEEWPAPSHRTIVAASTNERQVALALSSGELVYFEIDGEGNLAEFEDKPQMPGTVTALSLGDVPEGRLRSSFLAVGCDDETVRIYSLDPDSTLVNKSVQAVSTTPTALRMMAMPDSSSGGDTLYLHIGLQSGVYLRTIVDEVTGDLLDTRSRFLGARPVKLSKITVSGAPAILALATRPWLGYCDTATKAFSLAVMNYDMIDWGWNFSSAHCEEGIVGISGDTLRIFSVENIEENLLQESIPLMYTPKAFVRHPDYPIFYVGEADRNTLPTALRNRLLAEDTNGESEEVDHQFTTYGYPRGYNHWASCIQVVDPVDQKAVLETVELDSNEAVVSMAVCQFTSQDDEAFLVVGTGQDMTILPKSSKSGFIRTYRFRKGFDGKSLEFVHKTAVEEPPYALLPFQGRLVAGLGTTLRLYDLGMKQLLRKAQLAKVVPTCIVDLQTQGNRIICGDLSDGMTYITFRHEDNRFLPFCDDAVKRWTTCSTMLDYETTAGGDKFGNLWIVRCPPSVSQAADEDNGVQLLHEKGYLLGSPNRLELMVHFYVQDIPMSITRSALVPGGHDIILWAGLQGTIGMLIPFVSREDVDFFQKLEQELRQVDPPLTGRDHLMYRGYYVPVKGVIDGDLAERYLSLKNDVKQRIADELDRSVRVVERKIQDMRRRVAF